MTVKHENLGLHGPGATRVAYSQDGMTLLTGGSESLIRAMPGDPADSMEPVVIESHTESITVLQSVGNYFMSGDTGGNLVLHGMDDLEKKGRIARFAGGPVRDAAFDPEGHFVVAASSEPTYKIVSREDPGGIVLVAEHSKGLLNVSWSPDGRYIATSSEDGTLKIATARTHPLERPTTIKVLEGIVPLGEKKGLWRATWHPSGSFFVIGTASHDVIAVEADTWTERRIGGHLGVVTAVAFSKNGAYMATAADDGRCLVRETKGMVIVAEIHHADVTDMAFNPSLVVNLAIVDAQGGLTRYESFLSPSKVHPSDEGLRRISEVGSHNEEFSAFDDFSEQEKAMSEPAESSSQAAPRNPFLDDEELDGLVDDVPSENPPEIGGNPRQELERSLFLDEDADDQAGDEEEDEDGEAEEENDEDEEDVPRRHREELTNEDDMDLDLDDGMDDFIEEDEEGPSERHESVHARGAPVMSGVNATPVQAPFQPGSTPLVNDQRYMAYNMTGVVSLIKREDQNTIYVDMHDRSAQSPYTLDNDEDFSMASLGPQGLMLARSEEPSRVRFTPHEAWNSSRVRRPWALSMPADEHIYAASMGCVIDDEGELPALGESGHIALATDAGYVRILSLSGLQKYVWNIGTKVVCLASGQDLLMVVHGSVKVDSWQNLDFTLMDVETQEIVQRGELPLPQGATLTWAGFSETGEPAIYDSRGVLSVLSRARHPGQGRFVPVLDARRGQASFWITGVSDAHAEAVILKGGAKFPSFPTPLAMEVPLDVPLASTALSRIEGDWIKGTLANDARRDRLPQGSNLRPIQEKDLENDKLIITLFRNMCEMDNIAGAFDAATLLRLPQTIAAAAKLAEYFKLPHLREQLSALHEDRRNAKERSKAPRPLKYAHLVDRRPIPAWADTSARHAADFLSGKSSYVESPRAPGTSPVDRIPTVDAVPTVDTIPSVPSSGPSSVPTLSIPDTERVVGAPSPAHTLSLLSATGTNSSVASPASGRPVNPFRKLPSLEELETGRRNSLLRVDEARRSMRPSPTITNSGSFFRRVDEGGEKRRAEDMQQTLSFKKARVLVDGTAPDAVQVDEDIPDTAPESLPELDHGNTTMDHGDTTVDQSDVTVDHDHDHHNEDAAVPYIYVEGEDVPRGAPVSAKSRLAAFSYGESI